jgi:hypothetical protein
MASLFPFFRLLSVSISVHLSRFYNLFALLRKNKRWLMTQLCSLCIPLTLLFVRRLTRSPCCLCIFLIFYAVRVALNESKRLVLLRTYCYRPLPPQWILCALLLFFPHCLSFYIFLLFCVYNFLLSVCIYIFPSLLFLDSSLAFFLLTSAYIYVLTFTASQNLDTSCHTTPCGTRRARLRMQSFECRNIALRLLTYWTLHYLVGCNACRCPQSSRGTNCLHLQGKE